MFTKRNSYRFHIGYWVLVLIVAVMAWRSIAEFGRSRMLNSGGWQQHLVSVCQDNKLICKSIAFVDSGQWWTSEKKVEVTARKGSSDQGQQAYRLIDATLTQEQREFAKVYLLQDTSDSKPNGGHP
jgi:hypothetical protein